MGKYSPIRASLKAGSGMCFGLFTFLMTVNYFCGIYRFESVAYLAFSMGGVAGIYTYWCFWREHPDENGKVGVKDSILKTTPLFSPALNAKHPLLAPILRTGFYLACAVFTLFVVLSHLQGMANFDYAFAGAAIGGSIGLLEGYRRALSRRTSVRGEPV